MYTVTKVRSFRGRDGYGFNTDLMKDGIKIAFVIDEGCGGCLHYEWADLMEKDALNKHIKTLPKVKSPCGEMTVDIDLFVSRLVDVYEAEKKLKRLCKTKTLFRLKTDNEGTYRVIARRFDAAVKEFLLKKYGDNLGEIANERWL